MTAQTHRFELQAAASGDWPRLSSLLEGAGLPLAGAQEHLAGFLVAMADEVIVGCAGAERYGEAALLRSVAVAPVMQRMGVASLLVTRIIEELRRRGLTKLFLLTVGAQDYFARFGFAPESADNVPPAVKTSAEFRGACPDSASLMSLRLGS